MGRILIPIKGLFAPLQDTLSLFIIRLARSLLALSLFGCFCHTMIRTVDLHRCSKPQLGGFFPTASGSLVLNFGLKRLLLVSIVALVVSSFSGFVSRVEAGCGLYTQHGSDVRIISTSAVLHGVDVGANTYRQFFELLMGHWGPPEPVCSGPNCGRPREPFSAPDLATEFVRTIPSCVRVFSHERFNAPGGLKSAVNYFDDSHLRDGFLSVLEHPPRAL